MLSNQQIKDHIENAFTPLKCTAEIWDYEFKVRFKVFNSKNEGIVEMHDLVLDDIRDESDLQMILDSTRDEVKSKGYSLNIKP